MLLSLYGVCVTLRSQPFAWVPRGVYIGLPPGGTMVIRLGVGPSRLCLHSPASAPTAGARRLGGPTGCRLLGRQAGPTFRALLAAGYCCSILVARASPKWAWLQCRRPVGDHCSLTASCLLNGASSSREVASRLWGADSILGRLGEVWPPSCVSLPEGAHRPWAAPAVRRG